MLAKTIVVLHTHHLNTKKNYHRLGRRRIHFSSVVQFGSSMLLKKVIHNFIWPFSPCKNDVLRLVCTRVLPPQHAQHWRLHGMDVLFFVFTFFFIYNLFFYRNGSHARTLYAIASQRAHNQPTQPAIEALLIASFHTHTQRTTTASYRSDLWIFGSHEIQIYS